MAERWDECIKTVKELGRESKKTSWMKEMEFFSYQVLDHCFTEDRGRLKSKEKLIETMIRVSYPLYPEDKEPPFDMGDTVTGLTAVMTMLVGGVVRLYGERTALPEENLLLKAFGDFIKRIKACMTPNLLYVTDMIGIDWINREGRIARLNRLAPPPSPSSGGNEEESPTKKTRTSPRRGPSVPSSGGNEEESPTKKTRTSPRRGPSVPP
jgi:hypothetical protein